MKRFVALVIFICFILSMGSIIIGNPTKATPTPTPTLPPLDPQVFVGGIEEPKLEITYEGATPIAASLASKADKKALLKQKTVEEFSKEKYPLDISSTVKIEKYRCDDEKCGYWISAKRNGQPVAVNNPIWLINGNAPYHTVVSEYKDEKTNTEYLKIKEDVKGAVIKILTDYADRQPIGQPKVGTKE
jgi:hypothetical protein